MQSFSVLDTKNIDSNMNINTGSSCKYSRDKIECFRDLSIEISHSLCTALSQHFKDEKVELRCEKPKCNGTHAVKSTRIKKLPPILMIHLKRFHFDVRTGKTDKLNSLIDAPESLDLNTFMDVSHDQNTRYSLHGILRHHGDKAQGGHYTADVRLSNMGDDEKQWYWFDDLRVREGKFGDTERQRQETGYILVYVQDQEST